MEPLFLLFAIDQLMDMGRTVVTVLGNCVACVVIARWEGELRRERRGEALRRKDRSADENRKDGQAGHALRIGDGYISR